MHLAEWVRQPKPSVARSLPWTSGALLSAARHTLSQGIACAPVSGFRHASYSHGRGFCTFNGLMVTAAKLLSEKLVDRVIILDCDQHYGDGTEEIIQRLSLSAGGAEALGLERYPSNSS